ncbi:MAG: hypothetical protein U0V72_06385 [Cytophagales bacterium]
MDTSLINQKLSGIAEVIINEYKLSTSIKSMVVKSAKLALRTVTVNEYKEGHAEEILRILRSAKNIKNDDILKELIYEYAWSLSQKTKMSVLQAEAISEKYFPSMLSAICDAVYEHNVEGLLEYLEIEYSLTNKTVQKRQDLIELAKKEFLESFDQLKTLS